METEVVLILICFMATSQFISYVDGTVITCSINNEGVTIGECCINGTCPCDSLYYAYLHLANSSIANITSESVTLNTTSPIGSGILHNITIIIDGASPRQPRKAWLANIKELNATLLFNLSSFAIGFVYSKNPQKCGCYNDDNDDDNDDNNDDDNSSDNDDGNDGDDVMQCYGDITDIRQGYWFGNVSGTCTVSLCPIFYCDLSYHNIETVNRYYNFPRQTDDQCRPHRTGVACGGCSPGYTLAHNAPDCVDRKKCSGMLSLVIVLTILYWIIIVVGVCIMHSKFQISLGHLYGIIYFYSTVDVFLGNDLYTSDVVFQLVAVISSLAKLTPQFIGKLCSVEGLSGIDQQFINYIHVLAVSLILFAITKVVKYSRRMAYFGKHYIVRTICVLLLLAYTSLTSTSLQLLKPLTFNNVNDTFTFSSPDVKYFSGRHVVYGIVAILCVIIFVMGLPCLLLLEPFLQRKINLIKIKPLLDQFQGSYKDRYRWFAAYYFICRLAIFIISYTVGDYQSRLYFLQTTCVIIVVIHIWVQPYANELVNALDATILLNMVLVVNLNTYEFSDSTTKIICVFLVVTPICLLCAVLAQKPLTTWIHMKSKRHHDLDDATHLLVRNDGRTNRRRTHPGYHHFQETLLAYYEEI